MIRITLLKGKYLDQSLEVSYKDCLSIELGGDGGRVVSQVSDTSGAPLEEQSAFHHGWTSTYSRHSKNHSVWCGVLSASQQSHLVRQA
jgi:hypothetical protein